MPFVEWLYQQDLTDLDALPDLVEVEGITERADRMRAQEPAPMEGIAVPIERFEEVADLC